LYIHGGAFAVGSPLTYRAFHVALQRAMADRALKCRVLSLKYTLAPDAHYPEQLNQALAAYRWLVGVWGCRRIVLGGVRGGM
jgi:acetyl esterase/lipase